MLSVARGEADGGFLSKIRKLSDVMRCQTGGKCMSKLTMPLQRVTSMVLRYGLAVVSVAIALGLALLAQRQAVHNLEFPLFLMAIAVTAWYARAGPGVLAVVLASL